MANHRLCTVPPLCVPDLVRAAASVSGERVQIGYYPDDTRIARLAVGGTDLIVHPSGDRISRQEIEAEFLADDLRRLRFVETDDEIRIEMHGGALVFIAGDVPTTVNPAESLDDTQPVPAAPTRRGKQAAAPSAPVEQPPGHTFVQTPPQDWSAYDDPLAELAYDRIENALLDALNNSFITHGRAIVRFYSDKQTFVVYITPTLRAEFAFEPRRTVVEYIYSAGAERGVYETNRREVYPAMSAAALVRLLHDADILYPPVPRPGQERPR